MQDWSNQGKNLVDALVPYSLRCRSTTTVTILHVQAPNPQLDLTVVLKPILPPKKKKPITKYTDT
jgi:hypothetical protein